MPDGYLFTLGDGTFAPGDTITEPRVTVATRSAIRAGNWNWSGTIGDTTDLGKSESGVFGFAIDGIVNVLPDRGPVAKLRSDIAARGCVSTASPENVRCPARPIFIGASANGHA